jgi:hypothetical protein
MRDDFPEEVKRILAFRVSTTCSNPSCQADTSGPQEDTAKAVNLGVAAHITSASAGGPRYDPNLSSEQRSSIDNGIWLCQNCAKLIDNDVLQYPERVLRAWKTLAEHQAAMNVGKTKTPRFESDEQRKAHEILKWKDKLVTLVQINTGRAVYAIGLRGGSTHVKVLDCTEFYVKVAGDTWSQSRSIPLKNIELGHDDRLNCLELQERNL